MSTTADIAVEDGGLIAGHSGSPTVPGDTVHDDDRTPHLMRIAAQGKLRTYVAFALKFLQESHNRPLVLHTLPPAAPKLPSATQTEGDAAPAPDPPEPAPQSQPPQTKTFASSAACIPRLISVAEIIKREFVELMAASKDETKQGWRLHQYNELGCLEDLEGKDATSAEGPKGLTLVELLEGKNHLQIKRTPYMKITLTKRLLPEEDIKKSTYQEPLPSKKRSKSAKARERKKRKRAELASTAPDHVEDVSMHDLAESVPDAQPDSSA